MFGDGNGYVEKCWLDDCEHKLEKSCREITQLKKDRNYWQEKAEKLAEMLGKDVNEEFGEDSNVNCPVQNAIDCNRAKKVTVAEHKDESTTHFNNMVRGNYLGRPL